MELYKQNPPQSIPDDMNSEREVVDRGFVEEDFPLIPDDARNLSKEILLGAN